MRNKKKNLVYIIVSVLLCLGIGYAYLTTTLSINGVTDIDRNSWDVYFDNVEVLDGSVTGEQVIEEPTITSDTEVEFHVNLKQPGDYYEFTVDAKNDGTIDAMVESVTKKVNGGTTIPAYLDYNVTYDDGVEIQNNHLLEHENLETYLIKVGFKSDISASDLPTTAQSLTLSFTANYVQADEDASQIRNYIYSSGQEYFLDMRIGAPIPNMLTYFNSYQQVLNNWDYDFFLRSNIKDNNIVGSDVGFVIDDNVYYLIGGNLSLTNIELDNINSKNKETLIQAFGIDNCIIDEYGIECQNDSMMAGSAVYSRGIKIGCASDYFFCEVGKVYRNIEEIYRPICGTENI